jgi:hypothetical protein
MMHHQQWFGVNFVFDRHPDGTKTMLVGVGDLGHATTIGVVTTKEASDSIPAEAVEFARAMLK